MTGCRRAAVLSEYGWIYFSFPIFGSCPTFSVSGQVFPLRRTQHVITPPPLSIANELLTVRPLSLDHWRANHLDFRKHLHVLSFSLISLSLIPLPLSNNARTDPLTRSVTTSPRLCISSNLSNKFSETVAQPGTKRIRSPPPFRHSRNPATFCKGRSNPQNRSTTSTRPSVALLEVWMASCREKCVRSNRFPFPSFIFTPSRSRVGRGRAFTSYLWPPKKILGYRDDDREQPRPGRKQSLSPVRHRESTHPHPELCRKPKSAPLRNSCVV